MYESENGRSTKIKLSPGGKKVIRINRNFGYFSYLSGLKIQMKNLYSTIFYTDRTQYMKQLYFRKSGMMMTGSAGFSTKGMRMDYSRTVLNMNMDKQGDAAIVGDK